MMCLVTTTRGNFILSARNRNAPAMITTVGMPASSKALATCPTDT